jgi:predicted polyphosphate/ATP-dependent NAD kinase
MPILIISFGTANVKGINLVPLPAARTIAFFITGETPLNPKHQRS